MRKWIGRNKVGHLYQWSSDSVPRFVEGMILPGGTKDFSVASQHPQNVHASDSFLDGEIAEVNDDGSLGRGRVLWEEMPVFPEWVHRINYFAPTARVGEIGTFERRITVDDNTPEGTTADISDWSESNHTRINRWLRGRAGQNEISSADVEHVKKALRTLSEIFQKFPYTDN